MSSKGFTLVEILVVSVIFLLIIGAAAGLFVSLVRHQRRILAKQELLNQISYVMEYMSRALRMAKKELNCTEPAEPPTCSCLTDIGYGWNYEITPEGKGIKFINHSEDDVCQEFFWNEAEKRLEESKDGSSFVPLTSDKLQINLLKFNVSGESGGDLLQPRVTIFLEIQAKGAGDQPKIQIQTTISQRNLDVQ